MPGAPSSTLGSSFQWTGDMQIFGLDITELANATILLLTALVTWAAVYVGRRTTKPQPTSAAGIQVEGAAIVSSSAIHSMNAEMAALRASSEAAATSLASTAATAVARMSEEGEKNRKIGHRLSELADRAIDEMAELRREIADLSREVARRK